MQQAERDRYQAARRLYEEQLLVYQGRKARYELLKGQQHRLHLALAGIWAGWCERLASAQLDTANRSLCGLLLGSMEAVHRLAEHMRWLRGREIWRALLKLAQTMTVASADAADELDSGTQMRSLAGLLSASRCDWLDQFDPQPNECGTLGQFKLSFIRNQIRTMETGAVGRPVAFQKLTLIASTLALAGRERRIRPRDSMACTLRTCTALWLCRGADQTVSR
ncbi:GCN1 proteinral control of amino-acid synthesis 1-like 1 [Cyanidiococcus yangmingshanensis]|uniref:GCN1 proteinral control of amino-acid synthesis 1-like 1 n=1 Tax=Cyanidiococcus yangmingshanensis TaxID=2690220 RepID=A0A7J7IEL9_9RHOD|nr:GCN1 proteinral control of amino-acid synthesis 1-like 1 [Cyanidiococcus yangmingshanensis]